MTSPDYELDFPSFPVLASSQIDSESHLHHIFFQNQPQQFSSFHLNLPPTNNPTHHTNTPLLSKTTRSKKSSILNTQNVLSCINSNHPQSQKFKILIQKYPQSFHFTKQNSAAIKMFLSDITNSIQRTKALYQLVIFMQIICKYHYNQVFHMLGSSVNSILRFVNKILRNEKLKNIYVRCIEQKAITLYVKYSNRTIPSVDDLQNVLQIYNYQIKDKKRRGRYLKNLKGVMNGMEQEFLDYLLQLKRRKQNLFENLIDKIYKLKKEKKGKLKIQDVEKNLDSLIDL